MDQIPIRILRAARLAAHNFGLEPLLKRSRSVTSLYRAAYSQVKPRGFVTVDLPGHTLTVHSSDSSIAYNLLTRGAYEPFESKLFREAVAQGGSVLDIGAHVGYYTLMAANAMRGSDSIWAFEPHPANCKLLCHNIARNHFHNVIVTSAAVSDHEGRARLFLAQDDNTGGHSLAPKESKQEFAVVPLVRVDDVVPAGTRVSVIKMDTEGGEVEALRGMRRVLEENDPVIFTEFFPDAILRAGNEPRQYLEILSARFELFVIDDDREMLTPMTVEEILRACPAAGALNLLCKRPE